MNINSVHSITKLNFYAGLCDCIDTYYELADIDSVANMLLLQIYRWED